MDIFESVFKSICIEESGVVALYYQKVAYYTALEIFLAKEKFFYKEFIEIYDKMLQ